MKVELKPLRLSRDPFDLFKPHPYELWDQALDGDPLRRFISPYSFATYLHVNGAIDMYYMGVRSENTICCKVLDPILLKALIASLRVLKRKSLYTRLKFKLILWLGSRELITIRESL